MKKKPQKTMHISYDESTEDLFFEVMRKSNMTLVPLSVMARHYMSVGLEHDTQFSHI